MAPYQEHGNGNGLRQQHQSRDPLEVTRTTSNNSIDNHSHSTSTSTSIQDSAAAATTVSECDYDTNPTVLYQAIEAKQWDYAISLFANRNRGGSGNGGPGPQNNNHNHDDDAEEEASATWVVRKECNGKLRWRLLPLHAAVIFGSPLALVELLLADYPLATQCKDDQGMLPLHLAFRHKASWDVIEELLTTHPLAVFCSDRKGRTPLQCGVSRFLPQKLRETASGHGEAASNYSGTTLSRGASHYYGNKPSGGGSSSGAETHTETSSSSSSQSSSFRTIAGVLGIYSQIVVSGERKAVEQETRALAQAGMNQMREVHQRRVEALHAGMDRERAEAGRKIEALEKENSELLERIALLEQQSRQPQSQPQPHPTALPEGGAAEPAERVSEPGRDEPGPPVDTPCPGPPVTPRTKGSVDRMLRKMAETMVKQQRLYQSRVGALLASYEEMVTEREAMRFMLLKGDPAPEASSPGQPDRPSPPPQSRERRLLQSFRKWFREEEEKLSQQERSLSASSRAFSPPPAAGVPAAGGSDLH
ncbi:unnamed protein product [Pseudo-nitzschia multistriata]|uniref:Uncharacterized protein n=1 Tax=Pseudo-nitzschia multistriata TaxID=183589 RepID=A0A448YW10_9STRA|nr:unnamed protein product [Pseudo-nitzschia multistriata]